MNSTGSDSLHSRAPVSAAKDFVESRHLFAPVHDSRTAIATLIQIHEKRLLNPLYTESLAVLRFESGTLPAPQPQRQVIGLEIWLSVNGVPNAPEFGRARIHSAGDVSDRALDVLHEQD